MQNKRLYYRPEFLLKLYLKMQAYLAENQRHAPRIHWVKKGFGSSTSVILYYYRCMEDYGMVERKGAKKSKPSTLRLLPLDQAHPTIQELFKKLENSNV